MTIQYFEDIIQAARERHNIDYINVTINVGYGEPTYSVGLKIKGDGILSHIHGSTLSLDAVIEEAVRRAAFDNGREPVSV